jgi:hypothetical protein
LIRTPPTRNLAKEMGAAFTTMANAIQNDMTAVAGKTAKPPVDTSKEDKRSALAFLLRDPFTKPLINENPPGQCVASWTYKNTWTILG